MGAIMIELGRDSNTFVKEGRCLQNLTFRIVLNTISYLDESMANRQTNKKNYS